MDQTPKPGAPAPELTTTSPQQRADHDAWHILKRAHDEVMRDESMTPFERYAVGKRLHHARVHLSMHHVFYLNPAVKYRRRRLHVHR